MDGRERTTSVGPITIWEDVKVEKRNKRREFRGEQRGNSQALFASPLKLHVILEPLPSCETQVTHSDLVGPLVAVQGSDFWSQGSEHCKSDWLEQRSKWHCLCWNGEEIRGIGLKETAEGKSQGRWLCPAYTRQMWWWGSSKAAMLVSKAHILNHQPGAREPVQNSHSISSAVSTMLCPGLLQCLPVPQVSCTSPHFLTLQGNINFIKANN